MKVWSEFSTILKLALICLLVGFVAGFCASVAAAGQAERPERQSSTAPALH